MNYYNPNFIEQVDSQDINTQHQQNQQPIHGSRSCATHDHQSYCTNCQPRTDGQPAFALGNNSSRISHGNAYTNNDDQTRQMNDFVDSVMNELVLLPKNHFSQHQTMSSPTTQYKNGSIDSTHTNPHSFPSFSSISSPLNVSTRASASQTHNMNISSPFTGHPDNKVPRNPSNTSMGAISENLVHNYLGLDDSNKNMSTHFNTPAVDNQCRTSVSNSVSNSISNATGMGQPTTFMTSELNILQLSDLQPQAQEVLSNGNFESTNTESVGNIYTNNVENKRESFSRAQSLTHTPQTPTTPGHSHNNLLSTMALESFQRQQNQSKLIHLEPLPDFTDRQEIKPWLQKIFYPLGIDIVIERSDTTKVIFKCKALKKSESSEVLLEGDKKTPFNGAVKVNEPHQLASEAFIAENGKQEQKPLVKKSSKRQVSPYNQCPFRIRATLSMKRNKWNIVVVNNAHSHPLKFDPESDTYKQFKTNLKENQDWEAVKKFDELEYRTKFNLPTNLTTIPCDCGLTEEVVSFNVVLPSSVTGSKLYKLKGSSANNGSNSGSHVSSENTHSITSSSKSNVKKKKKKPKSSMVKLATQAANRKTVPDEDVDTLVKVEEFLTKTQAQQKDIYTLTGDVAGEMSDARVYDFPLEQETMCDLPLLNSYSLNAAPEQPFLNDEFNNNEIDFTDIFLKSFTSQASKTSKNQPFHLRKSNNSSDSSPPSPDQQKNPELLAGKMQGLPQFKHKSYEDENVQSNSLLIKELEEMQLMSDPINGPNQTPRFTEGDATTIKEEEDESLFSFVNN